MQLSRPSSYFIGPAAKAIKFGLEAKAWPSLITGKQVAQ